MGGRVGTIPCGCPGPACILSSSRRDNPLRLSGLGRRKGRQDLFSLLKAASRPPKKVLARPLRELDIGLREFTLDLNSYLNSTKVGRAL